MRVRSLASLRGLQIQECCELGCRSQMWLRSRVAVAVVQAGSFSSHSTPSPGTSTCCRCSPRRPKKKKAATVKGGLNQARLWFFVFFFNIKFLLAVSVACRSSWSRDQTLATAATMPAAVTMPDAQPAEPPGNPKARFFKSVSCYKGTCCSQAVNALT